MSLVPWNPFPDMDRFFENEDWLLPVISLFGVTKPAMDIYETDKDVVAKINFPDIDPKKMDISVENNVLKVSGKKETKKEEKKIIGTKKYKTSHLKGW